ncbi:MAG: GNAT family N-acetyltransferase [Actinomadura rubrobrunea]|nr:GNAT family N-acetyltransferase [Actinomadura rubrobrunea]
MATTSEAMTLQGAAFLTLPDAALRETFLEAMAEHEAIDGTPDADGLTMADLRTGNCVDCYTDGLRNGTSLRPGTEPMRSTVWWYVTQTARGREYLGRVSIRHYPATSTLGERGSQIWVTVRPSKRGQGLGRVLLTAALPLARANGLDDAVVEIEEGNHVARHMLQGAGARQIDHRPAERARRHRFLLPTT